ncbi:MAG TPA: hypothetical protein VK456_10195 [Xanthobacteraceae bacterium]|nr:hypothetical protein [Xanthobacteraceae bacterium]
MLVLGAASNAWEMLSSLQPANASAPAAGIGVGSFLTDGTISPATAAAGGLQSAPPPTGTTSQASLSPDVLGFLIWNQSQQPGSTQPGVGGAPPNSTSSTNGAPGGAAGTADATSATTSAGLTPWQSLFSLLGSGGNGTIASSAAGTALGANGSTTTSAAPPNQSSTPGNGLPLAGDPGAAAPESSGTHWHHHHRAGFTVPSQSNSSDPFANLLGTSAQGASSTTAANANGSTTTTITYGDGSEVTLTTPPQAPGANPGTTAATQPPINPNNLVETLIQMQARLVAPTTAA